jgi:hypothetical protein
MALKMTMSKCYERAAPFFAIMACAWCTAACRNGLVNSAPERMAQGAPLTSVTSGVPSVAQAPRSDASPQPTGLPVDSEYREPDKLAKTGAETLGCRVDADCVITCRSDGSCCLEQCGCSTPMSRSFLERLEVHLARECGPKPLCPVAGCVGTKLYEAHCTKGRCSAVKLPGGV